MSPLDLLCEPGIGRTCGKKRFNGVHGIGFGTPSVGSRELTVPFGIDAQHRDAGRGERQAHWRFQASCWLEFHMISFRRLAARPHHYL